MKKVLLLCLLSVFLSGYTLPTIEDFRDSERLKKVNEEIIYFENQLEKNPNDSASKVMLSNSQAEKETHLELEKDYKNFEYEELARYANNRKGELILVRGKILQKVHDGLFWNIRLATEIIGEEDGLPQYGEGDVYLLRTTDKVIDYYLEDDIVDVFGTIMGKDSYTTVLGAEKELPLISTTYVWTAYEYKKIKNPTP